jgi:putative ABC transport system permease protein
VSYQAKSSSFRVRGDHPEFRQIEPLLILKGRFLNQLDLQQKRKVAVIGERVIEVLFGAQDPVGQYINIKGAFFRVVGVCRSHGKGEDLIQDAQTIYIPTTTLQQTYNQGRNIGYFAMTPQAGIPAAVIEEKVKQVLMQRLRVDPRDLKAFGSANVEKEFQEVQGLFTGIAAFSWIVSIGTILAGIIGVGNIMLIVVKERTKEIGVRKALGATPWSIISLIIQESVVITAFAGYLGLLAGTGVIALIDYLMTRFAVDAGFFSNPEVNVPVALAAIGLLVITGTLAGLIPATKAARVNPVEALRDE